jgi:ABC-type branched-subunit amino acid transport system substrate-binding protein
LQAAHECGLIHRDIKPANIWLEALGRGQSPGWPDAPPRVFRAKILDFGLARLNHDQSHLTQPGLVMGTPAYMAPEQVEGHEVDARCDLFSMGCVLYQLAAGQQPFLGDNSMAVMAAVAMKNPKPPREQNPDLPPPLAKLILQLLSKKPEDRPASAQAVIDTLEPLAWRLGVSTDATPDRASPGRRLRFALGAGVLVVLLLTAITAWQFYPRGGGPHASDSHEAIQGVRDTEILLGMSGPFHGPASELGRELRVGINAYIRHRNEQGIAGRKLKLVALDDFYDPERALANVRELNETRKVFAFIGNVGTPTAMSTLPYLLQEKRLLFGAFTGAKILRRDPPDRYVFNYRASLEEETCAIVRYLVNIRGVKPDQIAVFAQDDNYGHDGFNGVVKTLREYGRDSQDILRVGYDRDARKIDAAVAQILEQPNLRAIVMVPTYKPAAAFIRAVRDAKPEMIFASVSFVGSEALAAELLDQGPQYAAGVIVSQVVPPVDSSLPLVANYRNHLKQYYPIERPGPTSLEGYIVARILAEGLMKAGEKLDTETLIEALESFHHVDVGLGATISFGPSEHQASHKVWGAILDKKGQYQNLESFSQFSTKDTKGTKKTGE